MQLLRWTIRWRLAALLGLMILVSACVLLAVAAAFLLHTRAPYVYVLMSGVSHGSLSSKATLAHFATLRDPHAIPAFRDIALAGAGILALIGTVAVSLGWILAGRALRPVRMITQEAREISERNLHHRLAVTGPADELQELTDTLNGLLGRLEAAFEAKRRFIANASHELRTPLALQRTVLEVALADPNGNIDSLRAACTRAVAVSERQERLIEALLTLAYSEQGLEPREPVDLAHVVSGLLDDIAPARSQSPSLHLDLNTAVIIAVPRLLDRLAANLLDNSIRHNVPNGWVRVFTGIEGRKAILRVANSGASIPSERIRSLFQPFDGLDWRTSRRDGHGLGLSIVAAIAAAHEARISAEPLAEGGLSVTVAFEARADPSLEGR